jgi:hypothetical protein
MMRFLVGGVGLLIMLWAVMNFSGTGAYIEAAGKASRVVVETIDAGNSVSMSYDSSFWNESTTLTTTKGVFIVRELVSSIIIGEPLVIKKLQNGRQYLCNEEATEFCYSIN